MTSDAHVFADDADLDEPPRIAIEAIRSERISDGAVKQVQERAHRLASTSARSRNVRANRMRRSISLAAAIAGSVIIAIWGIGLASSEGVFADVLAAVQEQVWIRVTTGGRQKFLAATGRTDFLSRISTIEHRYCATEAALTAVMDEYADFGTSPKSARIVPIGTWCVYWWQ